MRKLLSEIGETMVESMVSMLIIVLVFASLTNAVVTAARINASLESSDVAFAVPEGASGTSIDVTVDGERISGKAKLYEAPYGEDGESRYYYYEYDGS